MRFLFPLPLLLLLSSCEWVEYKQEFSPVLHEPATVIDVIYTPRNHGSGVSPTISFSGKMGLAFTSITIPEKYAIVFQCQHGKFVIENNQDQAHALYEKLNRGDVVDIAYREQYQTTISHNGDAPPQITARALTKYDFLSATKVR